MKTLLTTLSMLIAALSMPSFAAGPDWPPMGWKPIGSRKEAHATAKIAIACKDCKTVNQAGNEKVAAGFFAKNARHDCGGCKGKMTVKQVGGRGTTFVQSTHECTKCGKDSAMTCATHVRK